MTKIKAGKSLASVVLVVLFSPFVLKKEWPYILHWFGFYDKAFRSYSKRIRDDNTKDEAKGSYLFNQALIYKMQGNKSLARECFIRSREKGCYLNLDDYSGETPARPVST